MPYTSYPTAANALALLPTSISSQIPTVESDAAVDAAIASFENQTGWRPFLAGATATSRILPSPDYRTGRSVLILPQGAVSVTEVQVDLNDAGVGTVLTPVREYNLEPTGADTNGRPFTRIAFGRFGPDYGGSFIISDALFTRQSAYAGKCKVTARWGFCTELPADVFLAIMRKAAGDLLLGAKTRLSGGLVSWEEADVKENFGGGSNNPMTETIDGWEKSFNQVVAKYQRLDR